jgi:hypothetical protein
MIHLGFPNSIILPELAYSKPAAINSIASSTTQQPDKAYLNWIPSIAGYGDKTVVSFFC